MARSSSSKRPKRRSPSHRLDWRGVTCRVRHTRDYLNPGTDHIEIEVVSPKGAPLPVTTTGYRSHFIAADDLAAAGGAVAFVTRWLDREATTKAWIKTDLAWRQGDLFAGKRRE